MKIPTVAAILLPLLAASSANAWELTVSYAEGGSITSHGTTNSGCVNYGLDDRGRKVNRAKFKDSLLADTFELYTQKNCKGKVSYRNGEGSHKVSPARRIQSYKVY